MRCTAGSARCASRDTADEHPRRNAELVPRVAARTDLPVLMPEADRLGRQVECDGSSEPRCPGSSRGTPFRAGGVSLRRRLRAGAGRARTSRRSSPRSGSGRRCSPRVSRSTSRSALLAMAIGTALGACSSASRRSRVLPPVRGERLGSPRSSSATRHGWCCCSTACCCCRSSPLSAVTIPLPDWLKATFGLSLPVMANMSEIVRGAIQSIPSGQWESAELVRVLAPPDDVDDHPAAVHQAHAAAVDEPLRDPDGRHRPRARWSASTR